MAIIKGSALASLIGVTEFLYQTQAAVGTTFEPIPFYLFAAAVYFLCAFGLSQASHVIERDSTNVELAHARCWAASTGR